LPFCQGTRKSQSGCSLSDRKRSVGSFVTGTSLHQLWKRCILQFIHSMMSCCYYF